MRCPYCDGTGFVVEATTNEELQASTWYEKLGFKSIPDLATLRGHVDAMNGADYAKHLDSIREGWKAIGPAPKLPQPMEESSK